MGLLQWVNQEINWGVKLLIAIFTELYLWSKKNIMVKIQFGLTTFNLFLATTKNIASI